MGVSKIEVPPQASILIGLSLYKPSILGTPIFGNSHINTYLHLCPCMNQLKMAWHERFLNFVPKPGTQNIPKHWFVPSRHRLLEASLRSLPGCRNRCKVWKIWTLKKLQIDMKMAQEDHTNWSHKCIAKVFFWGSNDFQFHAAMWESELCDCVVLRFWVIFWEMFMRRDKTHFQIRIFSSESRPVEGLQTDL